MWVLYLIAIYFIFYLIVHFFKWIVEKRHQKIRDEVANDLFSNSDIETKIENCKKKLSGINMIQRREVSRRIPNWEWSRLPKYAQKIVNTTCPLCGEGYLKVDYFYNRFGRVASSFSCSHEPECVYKTSLKKAKVEFEQENTKSFKKDFNQAYSQNGIL